MGTRGLRIVFFRGRYFVYYYNYDSYLEGLGKQIVDGIPSDPEQYKEWLQSNRDYYETLMADLENEVLTVTEDQLHCAFVAEDGREDQGAELVRWKAIDDKLEELPTAFADIANNLMIEWTYLINLDNETFSVNNWIFFDLWNIPNDRWIQAFQFEDDGEISFSFAIVPEAWDGGIESADHFKNGGDERDALRAAYEQYHCSIVHIKTRFNPTIRHIVGIALFEQLSRPHVSPFPQTISTWNSDDFGFREVAFAVLSLAAGKFYFDQPDRFEGEYTKARSVGYLVGRDVEDKPQLMPLFGSGARVKDQEPGSAPESSVYWFANVLISLVPSSVFRRDTEAAVAQVVEFGLAEGHRSFQAMLFSLFEAVFLEVSIVNGVKLIKHTRGISILQMYGLDTRTESMNISAGDSNEAIPGLYKHICHRHQGFISLQNFFNVAADRHLSNYGQGIFPIEIYDRIIAKTDRSTHESCAEVSRTLRELCQRQLPFGGDLTILKVLDWPSLQRSYEYYNRVGVDLADLGTFVFSDKISVMRSKLDNATPVRIADREKFTMWCPVIGTAMRPSMIVRLDLNLLLLK